jgi:hypothetical protein
MTESAAQANVRLEASQKGARLWRNNLGATTDSRGNFFRYGLANDSAAVNKTMKSSDLIGILPIVILPEHVGHIFGQFLAREMKAPGWKYTGTEREVAQLNFINLINDLGGNAAFATGRGTI